MEKESEYIYYVYKHVDPRTGELLYIGHGCRGRAWIHGSERSVLRSTDHFAHLEAMTQDGFLATDWVEVTYSGISKKDACKIEQALIRELQPIYNKPQGLHLIKLDADMIEVCKSLREEGKYYHEIAAEVGVSTMTVYRALNNQTKNLKVKHG